MPGCCCKPQITGNFREIALDWDPHSVLHPCKTGIWLVPFSVVCCHYYCFSKMVNLGKTEKKAKITMETCLFLFFNYFFPLCMRPALFIKTSLDTFSEKEKELVAP